MKPDGGALYFGMFLRGPGRDCSIARNQKEIFSLLALYDFRWKLHLIEGIVNIILKMGLSREDDKWWYK